MNIVGPPTGGQRLQETSRVSPPPCHKPLVGSLVTALRKTAWRLFGLQQAFDLRQEQEERALDRLVKVVKSLTHYSFHLRPGTLDETIFKSVVLDNEYRLPDAFQADDVIVDVGMHIGTFCYAVLVRGAGHVHGFEAEQQNYELAAANLKSFGARAHPSHKAVWRSDRKGDVLFHLGSTHPDVGGNTGGGSILWPTAGEKLDVVAFDDVLREATANGTRRVRLLKIDCEGSEFPILLTSRLLHLIDEIRGEFHEIGPGTCNPGPGIPPIAAVEGVENFTMDLLAGFLERAGFTVRWERPGDTFYGWFFATRGQGRT